MSREAMQMALEALEEINKLSIGENAICLPAEIDGAMDALRAAIEQAQEPVAWVYPEGLEALKSGRPWTAYGSNGGGRIPLYLNDAVAPKAEPRFGGSGAGFESLPASPKWQGLTDEEIKEIIGPWGETPIKGYTRKLFDLIEAKLKEKNT